MTNTEPAFEEWREKMIAGARLNFYENELLAAIVATLMNEAHSLGKKEGAAEERARILAAIETEIKTMPPLGILEKTWNAALQAVKTTLTGEGNEV